MTQEIEFYSSKVKYFFILITGLIILGLAVALCVYALHEEDSVLVGFGIFFVLLFGTLLFPNLRIFMDAKPYLMMTEKELIIDPFTKREIPIQWEDIQELRMREINFNKFVEIVLYDDEKYRLFMSKSEKFFNKNKKSSIFVPFIIIWGRIKRKDRNKLIYELNKRTVDWSYKLEDDMKEAREEEKGHREINNKYFWKSYGVSLILTVFAAFFLNLLDDMDISLSIVYFVLFPFAKVVYDLLFGFKFTYKLNKQNFSPVYYWQLHYAFIFLVYMFTPVIAPFGILYLTVRAVIKFLKK